MNVGRNCGGKCAFVCATFWSIKKASKLLLVTSNEACHIVLKVLDKNEIAQEQHHIQTAVGGWLRETGKIIMASENKTQRCSQTKLCLS